MPKFSNEAERVKPVHLEFFSPAPAGTQNHLMDIAPVKLLNNFHSRITASWRAIPAPDHIHKIYKLPPELKKYSLPIVPNTDFMPARLGRGPAWHEYQREFTDLMFVASTGLVAFGVATYDPEIETPEQLVGKKIGVVPKPSSLRVLIDAVIRDAWRINDKVTLIDCHPPEVREGLLTGHMDATFRIQTWEAVDKFEFLDPGIIEAKSTYWVGLSLEDIDRINKNNPWKLHRVLVPRGALRAAGPKLDPPLDVGMAGFNTAICAWDSTEDDVVYELVKFLDEKATLWPEYTNGCPLSLVRMSRWPGLTEDVVHPAALKYYKDKEIKIGEPVQLHGMN
jgi:hypothetical protein